MTQISRPFQIALAALVLFAAVWFIALHGHGSSGSSSEASAPAASSPSSAASTSTPAASASSAAKASSGGAASAGARKAQHAASSGSGELKRTIDKARGAVAHSHRAAHATNSAKTHSNSHAASKPTASKPKANAAPKAAVASANTQQAVEAQLKQGKVVAVLFWNPKGTVDRVVRRELQAANRSAHGGIAVHVALAGEIGAFGSFTKAVQVYATPTMLLIDGAGKTSSLTGLTDTFGIEQAVREVKQAK
jgi:hypothetical protein